MSPRLIAAAAALACAILPAAAQEVSSLAWMSGEWVEERMETPHSGSLTIETWMQPAGGVMLGTNLSGTMLLNQRFPDGSVRSGFEPRMFEFMRLARAADGQITFYASPNGGAAVPFRMVRSEPQQATFENADNDYPQRIEYRRAGENELVARISMIDGSRPHAWTFRRRQPPQRTQ